MNRYKVEVRTDSVLVLETRSESEAKSKALRFVHGDCGGVVHSRSVTKVTNLSDPTRLVADLAGHLQRRVFENGVCVFCGVTPNKMHTEDCVMGRARYFLDGPR